jgi:hypothetical protein
MDLVQPSDELSLAPLHVIQRNLDRIFGKGQWWNYELETISLELGIVFDDLIKDKISLLQIINQTPRLFYTDVLFFLHATTVINNNVAEFERFPLPSSLEMAYAFREMKYFAPGDTTFSAGIKKTIIYILTIEGYSEPVAPFVDMGIRSEDLVKGQEQSDTNAKALAVQKYTEAMNVS